MTWDPLTHDMTVTLSVRETRMIVERILLATGLTPGSVPAVGNCVLYSQAMGLGGMSELSRASDALQGARLDAIRLTGTKDESFLDAGGEHAWLVANDALDLALAEYRLHGAGRLTVRNASKGDELRVIEGLGQRHRARIAVEPAGEDSMTVRVVADRLPGEDAIMSQALRCGFAVPHALWRALYDRSAAALTPDSIESRRHAGPVMVDAEGKVHGRDDDDTDFELLLGYRASGAGTNERA